MVFYDKYFLLNPICFYFHFFQNQTIYQSLDHLCHKNLFQFIKCLKIQKLTFFYFS